MNTIDRLDEAATAEARTAASRGEDLVARSERVAEETLRRIAAIKADSRLTEDARRGDIAELTKAANQKRAALGAVHEEGLMGRLEGLRRRVCSPPGGLTGSETIAVTSSFRDALERAKRIEYSEAGARELAELARTARTISDPLLERAAMVVALERGDVDVLNAWAENHPAEAPALNELFELERGVGSIEQRFRRAGHFAKIG